MEKSFFSLVLLLVTTVSLFAQNTYSANEVATINERHRNAYREGEILVKFKTSTSVQMRAPQRQAFSTSQVNAVDALFAELGVDSIEQLMPLTGHTNVGKRMRAYNGSTVEVKDLSKLYRLTLSPDKAQTMHQAIQRLNEMEEVEFAEPNYIVYAMALPYDTVIPTQDSATYVSEPLYSEQWGLSAINLPGLWNKPKKSSKRPVIAILDTGVDIEHPDLAANIWTNTFEANGISGQDDDNNGFTDDIHGYDFVNISGVIADFNGHGTHCAGIAAAVGNNGIGITGANPDALIMPVTVLQSNGKGDIATIIRGIDYAAANGADVISMSLGTDAYSLAEEQALLRAYSSAILLAAAGNDYLCIYPHQCKVNGKPQCQNKPMFPAAFSFVLGVEASRNTDGKLASFSNFDEDGPVYSQYDEQSLYNYELRAPGVNIMSTFPGGRYKKLNGTSMACPMAAGAISRLLQCKDPLSSELLIGDLIHQRQNYEANSFDMNKLKDDYIQINIGNIDLLSTYNLSDVNRKPELTVISYTLVDSLGDGDGEADAGETIDFYPVFKNVWGTATNIKYWVQVGLQPDSFWSSRITLLQDTAYFQIPVSTYAHATAKEPLRMTINPECPDGENINMLLFATCDNATDTMCQLIRLNIKNGIEIGGLITDTVILYPDVHYIVTSNLAVAENALLIIKPGTILKFKDWTHLSCSGRIYAVGTPDSLITFTKADLEWGWSGITLNFNDTLGYCIVEYVNSTDGNMHNSGILSGQTKWVENTECNDIGKICVCKSAVVHNSIIRNNAITYSGNSFRGIKLSNSNVYDNEIRSGLIRGNMMFDNILRGEVGYDWGARIVYNPCVMDKNDYYFQKNNVTNNYNSLYLSDEDIENYVPIIMGFSGDDITLETRPALYQYLHGNWFGNDFAGMGFDIGTNSSSVWDVSIGNEFYLGSAREEFVRKHVRDIDYPGANTVGRINLDRMATRPMSDTHGIVWKILVDGYDAQDEFDSLPPMAIGKHRCDVYFNRPMDVTIAPTISFGVRAPFDQHLVLENGAWSADSTYYTAYFTIDSKTLSDGLNTFSVTGAQDPEHFEIPEESKRFHIEIAAAGSMSTGLVATPGLGKVTLTWETDEEDFIDLLGYNIYRWSDTTRWDRHWDYESDMWIEAGWRIDTLCINTSLIEPQETSFVDYDVIPGKAYYYVIRQVTTSLTVFDISNVVTATPKTAAKGDANGDLKVNVVDVVTEVNYVSHHNPQPFIFEAADVNEDGVINILDIVGTVQLILNPLAGTAAIADSVAYYYIENGILFIESDVVLGGIQLSLHVSKEHPIIVLDALNGFEIVNTAISEEGRLFMAYSLSGKTLGIGKHALLQIGDADISDFILSDAQGHKITAIQQSPQGIDETPFQWDARKYIDNGHLYIQRGNRVYTATGLLIQTK